MTTIKKMSPRDQFYQSIAALPHSEQLDLLAEAQLSAQTSWDRATAVGTRETWIEYRKARDLRDGIQAVIRNEQRVPKNDPVMKRPSKMRRI